MKKKKFLTIFVILIMAVIIGFFDLPKYQQENIIGTKTRSWMSGILDTVKLNLGLDLQGGSQLDYKIDLRKVPVDEQKKIVEGILNVLNKRVNSLGVSEPNIYTSDLAGEKHIIVELAGIKDLEEAKKIVGKTIQLEFKERRDEPADPKEEEKIKKNAQIFLDKIKAGSDMKILGQEEAQANPGKIFFNEQKEFQFKDALKQNIADELFKLKPGQIVSTLVENTPTYTVDESGTVVIDKENQNIGYHILKLTEKRNQEREISTPRSVTARHILISYKGAERSEKSVKRTETEAKNLTNEIAEKLKNGEKFEDLAKQYSDDTSTKEQGGLLTKPITKDGATYVKEFEDAGFALKKAGELSKVTKTAFGFHIIKADKITNAKKEKKVEPQIKYMNVYFSAAPDPWKPTGLTGEQFEHANVVFEEGKIQPIVSIKFNQEGAKLFEQITERNVGKPLAIFLGGELITNPPPNVTQKISGGSATITGNYNITEADALARDLNTGAIPAPITLTGQYTIGATLGNDALAKSVYAGTIGFALVAGFMILFYRLLGFLAVIALCIYTALLLFLLQISLPAEFALVIALGIFIYLILRILKSRESTAEKTISFILSCFILFFVSFLLNTSVVLTLAGIAGVILSIGMAVDANILIFERVKEELRNGKDLASAIDIGFKRAWSSIRDSNFSSLITCGILFYFGSSIIQGFAFNLAAGILVSMFTAITISKTFIEALINTPLAKKYWLFGSSRKKQNKTLPLIAKRKILYVISGIILIASLAGIPIFGFKLGLDFTGGSSMELEFKKPISISELKNALQKSADIINKNSNSAKKTDQSKTSSAEPQIQSKEEKLDFSKIHIIPSENRYSIKMQHISSDTHDTLLLELKKNIKDFEEIRFSTIGPTVGESFQQRAVIAVIVASIMIVLYVAFAFRKVPRNIGKWRFGVTAIIALIHDLGIMLGVYVYLGVILGVEIDALFITALLTILGFSVHDTIVVFDRIREKLKYQKKDESFEYIANQAVNETMSRSINTSFSVLLTLLALVIFGSESIKYFVLSLLIGIISGTYSSIFIATPLLVDWQKTAQKKKEKLIQKRT